MDNLINGSLAAAFNFITTVCQGYIEVITNGLFAILSCDLTLFEQMFPVASEMYNIVAGLGFGIFFLLVILNALRYMGMPLGIEVENPLSFIFKALLVGGLLYFSKDLVMICLDFIKIPIKDLSLVESTTSMVENIKGSFDTFSSSDQEGVISALGLDTLGQANASLLLNITSPILICIILINFVKYMFEIFERYVLVGVLAYTAPIAASTAVTKSTEKIFASWIRMIFGQSLLLFFNFWFLKLFISGMSGSHIDDVIRPIMAERLGNTEVARLTAITSAPIVYVFIVVAVLKVAQNADEIMNRLGVSVAKTGGSIIDEIMGASKILGAAMAMPNKVGKAAGEMAGFVSTGSGAGLASAFIPGVSAFSAAKGKAAESLSKMAVAGTAGAVTSSMFSNTQNAISALTNTLNQNPGSIGINEAAANAAYVENQVKSLGGNATPELKQNATNTVNNLLSTGARNEMANVQNALNSNQSISMPQMQSYSNSLNSVRSEISKHSTSMPQASSIINDINSTQANMFQTSYNNLSNEVSNFTAAGSDFDAASYGNLMQQANNLQTIVQQAPGGNIELLNGIDGIKSSLKNLSH